MVVSGKNTDTEMVVSSKSAYNDEALKRTYALLLLTTISSHVYHVYWVSSFHKVKKINNVLSSWLDQVVFSDWSTLYKVID